MRGADPNKRGEDWPVCMAVRNPPILKRILNVLAEPRAFKGVIERAVAADQLESVKLLLAAGVSVEDKNGGVFSPLTTALRENHREIVRFLVDPNGGGADVNAPGEHLPVVKALRRFHGEDTAMLEVLLEHGADPNKMYRGWNGIFQAVENGELEVLQILKDKGGGFDLDAKDEMGRTAIEMASQRGWDEGVQILREGRRKQ
uniref:Ankyrin repeat domain-containing protein n=1 Tax=Bionectria ochroleuca TaxID=29856 RepID=A0A8H7NNP5_BIOOC